MSLKMHDSSVKTQHTHSFAVLTVRPFEQAHHMMGLFSFITKEF